MLELIPIDNTFTIYLQFTYRSQDTETCACSGGENDTVPSPAVVSWPLDHQRNKQIRCLDQRVIRKLGLCPHRCQTPQFAITTLAA